MSTVADIKLEGEAANLALDNVDLKLDTILLKIQNLQAGQPVTQEQIDEIFNMVNSLKVKAQAVSTEADTVDGA